MSDAYAQRLASMEQRLLQLEKDRDTDRSEMAMFKRDTEASNKKLAEKAEEIMQALIGTLTDKGLIPSFHHLKELVINELKPRVDALWTDRIRGGVIVAFISLVISALVAGVVKHFLP